LCKYAKTGQIKAASFALLSCSYSSPGLIYSGRTAASKYNRIAHVRNGTVQRSLPREFRNSVLGFPLKVTAKIDEGQKLTYALGGNCR
jgi:hypothetical protein